MIPVEIKFASDEVVAEDLAKLYKDGQGELADILITLKQKGKIFATVDPDGQVRWFATAQGASS